MKTIADYHTGRDNNFNLLRAVFALLVLCSHGFTIFTGYSTHPEPVVEFMFRLALAALDGFFMFSGFMITASIMRHRSLADYAAARITRIFPGLVVVSAVSAFFIGPLATTVPLPEYFSSFQTYAYVLVTSLTTEPDMPLPGLFKDQAWQGIVNLPIWTLRYEIFLYAVTAVLFAAGLLNRFRFGWFIGLVLISYIVKTTVLGKTSGIDALDHLSHFTLSFTAGMSFWIYRDRVILAWQVIPMLALFAWLANGTGFSEASDIAFIGYVIFWLAYVPGGFVRSYNRLGDYSYGIYIWHWPVASLLLAAFPQIGPGTLIPVLLSITIPIAVLSWHFVERPMLGKKTSLALSFQNWMAMKGEPEQIR